MEPQELIESDKYFSVATLRHTPNPQQAIWLAMHQDYCEDYLVDRLDKVPGESQAGQNVIKYLFGESGKRGHYGPAEHANLIFSTGYFPHSVMQQARTHRAGVSFDCQSMRYTSERICDVAEGKRGVDEVFYLRPVGFYTDRNGKQYEYTEDQRSNDKMWCFQGAVKYRQRLSEGLAPEHARGLLPFDFRQHFVVSFNFRSLMHFLGLRYKADAQLEIRALSLLLFKEFERIAPEIAYWFNEVKMGRYIPQC